MLDDEPIERFVRRTLEQRHAAGEFSENLQAVMARIEWSALAEADALPGYELSRYLNEVIERDLDQVRRVAAYHWVAP